MLLILPLPTLIHISRQCLKLLVQNVDLIMTHPLKKINVVFGMKQIIINLKKIILQVQVT